MEATFAFSEQQSRREMYTLSVYARVGALTSGFVPDDEEIR
jgi:hypothetical protein